MAELQQLNSRIQAKADEFASEIAEFRLRIQDKTEKLNELLDRQHAFMRTKAEEVLREVERAKREAEQVLEKINFENNRVEKLREKVSARKVFTLDVGGQSTMKVTWKTLTQIKESLLAKIFEDVDSLEFQPDGSIFIDRNPEFF